MIGFILQFVCKLNTFRILYNDNDVKHKKSNKIFGLDHNIQYIRVERRS